MSEHQGALVHPMLLALFGVNVRQGEVRAQMSDKTAKSKSQERSCAFFPSVCRYTSLFVQMNLRSPVI